MVTIQGMSAPIDNSKIAANVVSEIFIPDDHGVSVIALFAAYVGGQRRARYGSAVA